MRLSKLEKIRLANQASQPSPKVETDLEGLARKLCHATRPLLPTQREVIFSPERIALVMGAVGTAKTTTCAAATILPGLLYPGSRWGIFRWTYWTLEQTTMKRWFECINRLGPNIVVDKQTGPPFRVWLAPAVTNPDGSPGEPSEYVFHGLDDFEKLGGQEFNGIYVDEANEISESMATTLNMRLRHRLPGQEIAEGPFFLRLSCNPVRRSHWIHKKFCGESDCEKVPWGKKFRPRREENEKNLPPNYYRDAAAGLSPEMLIRFIEGECGPDPSGQPVFPEFRQSLHVGQLRQYFDPALSLIRSWDYGRRRPSCVFAQRTARGHVNRYLGILGENESTEAFARRMLQVTALEFPGARQFRDFCDPHGTAKRSSSDESDIDIMRRCGINVQYRDVSINTGLELMSKGLCTLIDGRPRSMYDRDGCAHLIEGYQGGYTYPEPMPGKALKEKPLADGFYEHLMDSDRYIEVNLSLGSTLDPNKHRKVLRKVRSPRTGY